MKAKLLQYNADGRMNDSEFIRMTADCDNEIKDIEKKINALKKNIKNRTRDEKRACRNQNHTESGGKAH